MFLDEVGELPPAVQVNLLRVLQDSTIERVGGEKTIQVNVRIISATNKDINREVTDGRFRRDLFYRLCVIPFTLPPLRDRKSDISLLVDYFLAIYTDSDTKNKIDISPQTLEILTSYHWPGNVRELQNFLTNRKKFAANQSEFLLVVAIYAIKSYFFVFSTKKR